MSQFDSGDLRIRTMDENFRHAGDVVPSHKHNFPHTTYINRGGVRLELPDETVEVWAHDECNWRLIPAGIEHRIVSLVDDTRVHCIYAHRSETGEVVPTNVGYEPAYW